MTDEELVLYFNEHRLTKLKSHLLKNDSSIEHELQNMLDILDGILDFGDDPRFLNLFKRLCRHLYYEYPQLVVDFISMYRLLFDEKGDSDGTSANHGEAPQGDL